MLNLVLAAAKLILQNLNQSSGAASSGSKQIPCPRCNYSAPGFKGQCTKCNDAVCSNCGKYLSGGGSVHYPQWCNAHHDNKADSHHSRIVTQLMEDAKKGLGSGKSDDVLKKK